MANVLVADVSEYQNIVDWNAYVAAGNQAAIARVCYGANRPDKMWARNQAGMRAAGVRVRGSYQYVVASQDIVAQAHAFVALVGNLQPGEFVVADFEEGSGDQSGRAVQWAQIVHGALQGEEWDYSGVSFANDHLNGFKGQRFVWVAAYGQAEPTMPHLLWQFTDRQGFAGIGTCDASIFHGSIDDLAALIAGGPTSPGVAMARFPNAKDACTRPGNPGQVWVVGSDGGVGAFGGAPFFGSYPSLPAADRNGDRAFLAIEPRADGGGYTLLADDGGSYTFPL